MFTASKLLRLPRSIHFVYKSFIEGWVSKKRLCGSINFIEYYFLYKLQQAELISSCD